MSNPNPPNNKNQPDRDLVARVAEEEAWVAGVDVAAVTGMSRAPRAVMARRRAWRRIITTTGCSKTGLARVWGCEPHSIHYALGQAPPQPGIYVINTTARLRWAHGDARAAKIIAGKDPATNADIAAWNALGSSRERAA